MSTRASVETGEVRKLDFWSFIDFAMRSERTAQLAVDTEAARLFMTLNRATKLVFFDLQSCVRSTEVSEAGFALLFILYQTGKMGMTKLTELSHMSRASVSAAIRTLAAQQLVTRERAQNDARSLDLEITEAGLELVESIYPEYNARERAWAALLDDEDRADLLRILNTLMDKMRASEDG